MKININPLHVKIDIYFSNKESVELLGYVPDNFIVRDFVPQSEVLKHSNLFTAHGGMGSVYHHFLN